MPTAGIELAGAGAVAMQTTAETPLQIEFSIETHFVIPGGHPCALQVTGVEAQLAILRYSPEARFNSATSAFSSATSACSVCRSVA